MHEIVETALIVGGEQVAVVALVAPGNRLVVEDGLAELLVPLGLQLLVPVVHEAFLRLGAGRVSEWDGRSHVLGVAAQAMRNVLADHARRNLARKRKGRRVHLPLSAAGVETPSATVDVLDLAWALDELAKRSERQARVVDLRFFCGLDEVEVAKILGLSERTVRQDWRLARAKLRAFLTEDA